MFDPSILFPALRAAGLLDAGRFTVGATVYDDVSVGFRMPGEVDFDGMARRDYEVEYETAKVPGLAMGHLVRVKGRDFKVLASPLAVGDGFYSVAKLTPA